LLDLVRLIGKGQCDVGDACATKRVDLIEQEGTIANGNDWFRRIDSKRTKTRAFTASKNECLHVLINY
jgi:hypothetical protein